MKLLFTLYAPTKHSRNNPKQRCLKLYKAKWSGGRETERKRKNTHTKKKSPSQKKHTHTKIQTKQNKQKIHKTHNKVLLFFSESQLLSVTWIQLQCHIKTSAKSGTGKKHCLDSSTVLTNEQGIAYRTLFFHNVTFRYTDRSPSWRKNTIRKTWGQSLVLLCPHSIKPLTASKNKVQVFRICICLAPNFKSYVTRSTAQGKEKYCFLTLLSPTTVVGDSCKGFKEHSILFFF